MVQALSHAWRRLRVSQAPVPPEHAPLTAFEKARAAWFECYGTPIVDRTRYFILSLIFGAGFLCMAIALVVIMPLKTVVPYVIERSDSGSVIPVPLGAQRFVPGVAEKRYFIAQWVKRLVTLDRYFTEPYLSEAYLLTRGKATVEFTDWLQRNGPMAELKQDPSLTRAVSISSVSLLQDDVALVRYATERRSMGSPTARRERFVMTIHFALVPPRSEEDLFRNPIGLFITHFTINDDLEKQP